MFLTAVKPFSLATAKGLVRFTLPVILLVLAAFSLHHYLQNSVVGLLAGIIAIYATYKKEKSAKKWRFAVASLLTTALVLLVPVHTLLFFAIAFALFFWVEVSFGSISWMGVVALFVASPAFQYASQAFSFPLRLQLAKAAGSFFSAFTNDVNINGNIIVRQGQQFAVDHACAGLHLFSLSILLGIVLLGLLQRKSDRYIVWQKAFTYLLALTALILLSNVLRIVLLVQFAIPPDDILHDVIGLLCLLFYVCLPACLIAKRFVVKAPLKNTAEVDKSSTNHLMLQGLVLVTLLLAAKQVSSVDTYARFDDKYVKSITGYSSSVYAPGILKLENNQALVYVKFIRGFYDTEHNPTMCWAGSGYTFKQTQKTTVYGKEIFTALLSRGTETLYTAWWYGNSHKTTTSQWEWRYDMLMANKDYAIINVTAGNKAERNAALKELLLTSKLSPLFDNSSKDKNPQQKTNR